MHFVKFVFSFYLLKTAFCRQQLNTSKPIVTACLEKSSTVYFGLIGYTLDRGSNAANISIEKEDQCISACTDQSSPFNRNIAINCSSFTLTANATYPCVLHSETAVPDGTLAIKKDPKSVLFQKFCLPGNALSYCFEQIFNLYVETSFEKPNRHKIHTSTQNTLAGCAAECVFQNCKAGAFDDESNLCAFYNDTISEFPIPIKGKKTQYYFENGCLRPYFKNFTNFL